MRKSCTNHITGEHNVSANSEKDIIITEKKGSVNLNKTVISGSGIVAFIITVTFNILTALILFYTVSSKYDNLNKKIDDFKLDTDNNIILLNRTIMNECSN